MEKDEILVDPSDALQLEKASKSTKFKNFLLQHGRKSEPSNKVINVPLGLPVTEADHSLERVHDLDVPKRHRIPDIWFHGTREDILPLLKEVGLSQVPGSLTLTSNIIYSLGKALDDRGEQPAITLWNVQPGDTKSASPMISSTSADIRAFEGMKTLRRNMTESEKEQLVTAIEENPFPHAEDPESIRNYFITNISHGRDRLLPADRLEAIIVPFTENSSRQKIRDEYERVEDEFARPEILSKYTSSKSELTDEILNVLNKSDVIFLREGITIEDLALEMTTAKIRTLLVGIGYQLSHKNSSVFFDLPAWMDQLNSIQFQEPAFERYRNILMNKYKRLPTVDEADVAIK